jgi:hypothetical protein
MTLSPFFQNLRSAYEAEIDDLSFDSEGKPALKRRLAEKRKEIPFLIQMMEISPEMVAVVLHQGFRFVQPKVMAHLLAQDADELPQWEAVCDAFEIAPWAQPLVAQFLQEPSGPWFLTVVAGLEYLYAQPQGGANRSQADTSDAQADEERARGDREEHDGHDDRSDDSHTEDSDDEEAQARAHERAGNDWLAEQGFDRKD